jgi:hypothetical protein
MTAWAVVAVAMSICCLILALECDAQRRRARFWKGAYDRQHEMHMRHLREAQEISNERTRLMTAVISTGRVWN